MVEDYIAVISDIHGNLTALERAITVIEKKNIKKIIILGDIIDYGPRSNQVIEFLKDLSNTCDIIVNIWGNHEKAIVLDEYNRFSSKRGIESARYTKNNLNEESVEYLLALNKEGYCEFELYGKKCLAIHGSIDDVFWSSIDPERIRDEYEKYDYVFSGHSHIPHIFSKYWKTDNPVMRNKKKTVFINPGSIGQPRDLNRNLSFALVNLATEECSINREEYDISLEQSFFSKDVDTFYKERISRGV